MRIHHLSHADSLAHTPSWIGPAVAVLCFGVACATSPHAEPRGEPTDDARAAAPTTDMHPGRELDSLIVDRGPCFGACPVYQLVLRQDGRLSVRRQGAASHDSITPAAAQRVLANAEAAGVLTLPHRIDADSSLCPLRATDHATVTLTAYLGQRMSRVAHYTGCYASAAPPRVATALERLVALEARLDTLAASVPTTGRAHR